MKFEQVIQAIRNGKQVKVADFDPIEVSKWTGEQSISLKLLLSNDWQIVPEYVDFAAALKAYRNSATIKSITGEKYSPKREDEILCVNLK